MLNFLKINKNTLILIYLYAYYNIYSDTINEVIFKKTSNIPSLVYKFVYLITDIDTNIYIIFIFGTLFLYHFFGLYYASLFYIFLYNFEIQNLYQYKIFNSYVKGINVNLINGLYNIHPLFLLIFFSLLFLIIIKNNKLKNISNALGFYIRRFNILNLLLLLSLLVLVTGGWWAQQELNWGGYWV